jgi:integrase
VRLRRKAARELGVSVETALADYERYLLAKGCKARSVKSTFQRLRAVFEGHERRTAALTEEEAGVIWSEYVARPTRFKAPPATDTQMNVLHETRTFTRWCESKRWSRVADPFRGIEILGSRRKGKDQIDRIDDARRWLGVAIELASAGDAGALAAATALLLGMRASEVTDRLVRDIDDGGRVIVIPHAKTRAGVRRLRIPEVLRPLVAGQSTGKSPTDRLFGPKADRYWLRLAVRRICRIAKTPVVGPHGLRGTHATLAVEAGVTGDVVAAALGHESFALTAGHYASAESVTAARTRKVEAALSCGTPGKFRRSSAADRTAA